MNANSPAEHVLRRHRWRARGTLLLWSAAATGGALAATIAARRGWWAHAFITELVLIAAAVALLVAWIIRVRDLTAQRLARELDERWALRARLETSLELAGDASALAHAQRADAAQRAAGQAPPGAWAWRGAVVALLAMACLVGTESVAVAWRFFTAPEGSPAKAGEKAAPAKENIRASIEWKSPESEIRATAIEEVPLTAVAESNTGFRSAALELLVNGERQVVQPLDAEATRALLQVGAHELAPSVFLDELHAKAFDVVAYRLVAELNIAGQKRVVSSPQQFIEIRAPQSDAELSGGASELPGLLFELKARQLQLLKQNSALVQLAAGAADDSSWATENTRVAAEQDKLATRVDEVLGVAKQNNPPPLVLDNLAAAKTVMAAAGQAIAKRDNDTAIKPQNRALALITELEQFIHKVMSGGGAQKYSDPIKDEQAFRLPPRTDTPAGQLEQLAAQDQQANAQLESGGSSASENSTAAGQQAAIAQQAEKLGEAGHYDAAIKQSLAAAAAAAKAAAQQLAADDRQAARVSAAAAQRALEQAVAAQEKAGRAAAVAALEGIRRDLNAASRAGASERAAKLKDSRDALRTAALAQQQTGSAEAAQELARLEGLLAGPSAARNNSSAPGSAQRVAEVAQAAAHAQVALSSRSVAVNRAVRLLKHGGTVGSGDGERAIAVAEVELASQEAQWIASDPAVVESAGQLAQAAGQAQRAASIDAGSLSAISGRAATLADALEQGREATVRDAIVRRFNPVDVDPLYRNAVETYFERLSRDARKPASAASADRSVP